MPLCLQLGLCKQQMAGSRGVAASLSPNPLRLMRLMLEGWRSHGMGQRCRSRLYRFSPWILWELCWRRMEGQARLSASTCCQLLSLSSSAPSRW